jgi:FkbH-like protein
VLARLSDVIAGTISPRCKLVVVDLDDTLWGGRVGDDGWDGIDLDPSTQGRHFLRMQAFLKGLHEKGVVLAIASKNEPSPVREVFEKRAEMMLSLDEFSAIEIHWAPKSESIARILARLNLSTAGVVFLDDNPAERAEVARRFPDICIPQLSENPADRVPALISSGLFDRRVSTAESRARHRMYAENAHREQALSRTGDIDEFLRDLNMVMEISRGESSQERVLELIQKTNQFNLTTRRYNWGELLAATNGGFVHCYRLKDKFGDNGIISVVAVSRDCSGEARIDLWLMSCRVFGRKVEDRIFRDVARRARVLGAKTLVGEYIETPKNDIVRNLYPRLGCSERGRQGEKVVYEYSIADEMVGAGDELFRIVDKTDAGARCRD